MKKGAGLRFWKQRSLRIRLGAFFAVFLLLGWLAAAFVAWQSSREYIDEFFDTQQMLLAKWLSAADIAHFAQDNILSNKEIKASARKVTLGDLEDDALSFAAFTSQGQLLLSDGKKGEKFHFEPQRRGFVNSYLEGKDDVWRIVWLDSAQGGHVIAVGQELEYRQDMALEMLGGQLFPWIVLAPVLILGLLIIVSRELAPLRHMASALKGRDPEDSRPLATDKIPQEAQPLVLALNGFFQRIGNMLSRERTFISDAAHELRTPLAGLRIQTQVASQADMPEEERQQAFAYMLQGIDRYARLVEQLLALSRLENMKPEYKKQSAGAVQVSGLDFAQVHWANMVGELVDIFRAKAESRDIQIYFTVKEKPQTEGYPSLLSTLVRNLLENAVSYTPKGGSIQVNLERQSLTIANSGLGMPAAYAQRLGERFFRPPGQEALGSGLGLSIVQRVAQIHGMHLEILAQPQANANNAFEVVLSWSASTAS